MTEPARLDRRIGLGGATLLSFNGAVGAAIFALPATLAADLGPFAPWLFPIAGILSLLVVIPFARSVAAFPTSGGPATYGAAFGRFAGFELGWIYYVARAAAFAANANVLIAYLARWWAPAATGAPRAAILVGVAALLAAVNIAGVKRAMALLGGFTVLKAVPLIVAAVVALTMFPLLMPGPLPSLSAVEATMLLVFYAFVGFENAVVPAGETMAPERTLPRALIATIAVTAVLYFLVQMAFVAAFPMGGANPDAPLIDLGQRLAGPTGAAIITMAAIASLAGNLHGIMTSTPRVTWALGERGDLPRWFAALSARFATPANSIAFLALVVALLGVSGSFVWLAVVSTLARMIVYAVTIAALARAPDQRAVTSAQWVSGAVGIALCILAASQADAKAWATLAALAAAGVLLFLVARPPGQGDRPLT